MGEGKEVRRKGEEGREKKKREGIDRGRYGHLTLGKEFKDEEEMIRWKREGEEE